MLYKFILKYKNYLLMEKKMKQKIGRIVKIICFCLVAVLMVNALEGLFKPKWLENRWASSKTNKSFYELEKNSTEVLFFGASVIAATADPYQLYEDYGISSYNLGVMSVSYTHLDVYKRQT